MNRGSIEGPVTADMSTSNRFDECQSWRYLSFSGHLELTRESGSFSPLSIDSVESDDVPCSMMHFLHEATKKEIRVGDGWDSYAAVYVRATALLFCETRSTVVSPP